MDDPMLEETSYDPYPAPTVSGFTPINHPGCSDTAPTYPEHEDPAIKSKSAHKPRAPNPKRRKTQQSAATTVSKLKKVASSKKTKRAKTAAQSDCQDISRGLLRTKPTSSGDGALPAKAGFSDGDILLEAHPGMRRLGNTSVEFEVKPACNDKMRPSNPSGLANKYQAAYALVREHVVNEATSPIPPKSDEVEVELNQNDQSYGQDSATERQTSPKIYVRPSIQKNSESDGSIIVKDFGAPPFTQMSPLTLQDRKSRETMMVDEFDPLDSISDDLFEVNDIQRGYYGKEDGFSMDDECLEEMMVSMAVPVEDEPLGSDWRPQDFSDDTLYTDEQLENHQSHWHGAIPDSDRLVIYDEDPNLMASNIIDAPSSTQWSSQASCILTHVTGNPGLDRTRSLVGSENCFDDKDLDDGLVDLMVDESKSLQSTSPITPTKRPLSPKLQWLSPKTYTPAKMFRLPLSPTDNPHLVPVSSNCDALPFMRPPFPKPVRDRSPILGLTNRTVLRICFRIGEALNAAAVASRTNVDAIIELYARVVSSSREANGGYKQVFQFGDLFTDKPPYLSGLYTFWKGVGIWDNDSKELVGEQGRGKMARVLGRIKKKEPGQVQGPRVEMVVLSIWEVDWEDVGVAKGIACPRES
ncbi:MAG: hypothetical protein Q9175_000011 [Cornicularia normoerica]